MVLAAQTLPMVVFMLVGGVIADRHPRSQVLLAGEWLAALGWSAIGVMLLTGYTPIWALSLAAAAAGIAGSLVYPALNGIIPDLVPPALRAQGNAWLAMGASASRLIGLVAVSYTHLDVYKRQVEQGLVDLARLRALDVEWLCCGHSDPVRLR